MAVNWWTFGFCWRWRLQVLGNETVTCWTSVFVREAGSELVRSWRHADTNNIPRALEVTERQQVLRSIPGSPWNSSLAENYLTVYMDCIFNKCMDRPQHLEEFTDLMIWSGYPDLGSQSRLENSTCWPPNWTSGREAVAPEDMWNGWCVFRCPLSVLSFVVFGGHYCIVPGP